MAGYIVHGQERSITLSPAQVDALCRGGSGDAALLYLLLQRCDRPLTVEELTERLRWTALRLAAAESALRDMGLISGTPQRPPEGEERPAYTAADLTELLEKDPRFGVLVTQTEEKLGKRLRTAELQSLAALYDQLGLPEDVIFLLVCHCIEWSERCYGPGRRPTLRQIEKEGYRWAQEGISDQESAARYIKRSAETAEKTGVYMRVLDLGTRRAVESERKYISQWIEWGFAPEAVALAYDKTVFYKKELNWRYLNGILRRWHENGTHTVEEIQRSDKKGAPAPGGDKGNDWMERYM